VRCASDSRRAFAFASQCCCGRRAGTRVKISASRRNRRSGVTRSKGCLFERDEQGAGASNDADRAAARRARSRSRPALPPGPDRLQGAGRFGRNCSCDVPNNRAAAILAAPAVDLHGLGDHATATAWYPTAVAAGSGPTHARHSSAAGARRTGAWALASGRKRAQGRDAVSSSGPRMPVGSAPCFWRGARAPRRLGTDLLPACSGPAGQERLGAVVTSFMPPARAAENRKSRRSGAFVVPGGNWSDPDEAPVAGSPGPPR